MKIRWRVFSTSPFENAVVFTQDDISVKSVKVSPATATVSKGQELKLSANVETTGFANKAVVWSISSSVEGMNVVTISADGTLKVPSTAPSGELTVTATSVYDNSVTGTATITVA